MKTSLQVYQSTPPEFEAVREFMVQRMIEIMRLFGINGIHTDWNQVGVSGVLSVDFTPTDVEPPGSFKTMRPKIVRWLAEGMQSLGISGVDTAPTETESKELQGSWVLAMAKSDKPIPEGYEPKLPPNVDPSDGSVV